MTTITGPSSFAFTPLESLLLFQSILKHGVEPDAFARIATVLQSNPFIRSDDRYNADRLTAESLQQLFLHLLRSEFGEDAGGSGVSSGSDAADIKKEAKEAKEAPVTDGKKRKIDTATLPAAHAEQLPILVERLYVRYREHIVGAIREDERRIEKVQAEIKLLEQQAAGGGGRGAHARAAEAKAAAAAAAATAQNGRQQQQAPFASASPTLGKNAGPAGPAGPANGGVAPQSVPSSRSTSASAQPPSARHTPEQHVSSLGQRGAASNVPLLPATSRPANQPPTMAADAAFSASTPSRIAASPALQHAQQQQQSRTTPQLAPLAPASASSQPPSRTPSAVAIQPTQPPSDGKLFAATPAGQLAGQSAAPSQLASRSISPAQPPAHLPPPPHQQQQSQSGLPPNGNAAQALPKAAAGLGPARETPPSHTPGTQTPIPNSPSTTYSAASQTAQPAAAPTQTGVPQPHAAGPQVGTPRPLVPATQKHTPIAPTPQFQRVPGGTPMTPGPQGAAAGGSGLVPRPPLPEHVRGGPPSRTPTPVQSPRPAFPHTPIQGLAAGAHGPMFLPRGSGTRWKPSEPTPSTPGPDVGDMASPAFEPLSPVQPNAASRSSRSARADSADLDMADDDADDDDASPISPSAGSSATALRQPRNLRKPQFPVARPGQKPERNTRGSGRPSRHSRSQGDSGSIDDDSHPIKAEASTPKASFDGVHEMDDDDGHARAALKRKRGGVGDDESVDMFLFNTTSNKPDPSVLARRRLVGPPTPPTHVLWMRGFPKISASALDQISSHRHANMFAHKIRDRDAPGYGSIVRHPVDLKSIRMAISQGNKAANTAIAALPESERESISSSNSSSVWLPINADLVPPRGIINSSQLESELVHMFANAIMYNPDSHRGPGPTFLVGDAADDDEEDLVNNPGGAGGDNARYKVDEDGVVNDTRDMYVEVEKLLSEMRSAERQRGMPAPPPGSKGLDLPLDDNELVGVVGGNGGNGGGEGAEEDEDNKNDKHDDEVPAAADADEGSGTVKRRRITRGQ